MAEEGLSKTANDLIHVGKPVPFDADEFLEQLNTLMKAAYENRKDIREQLQKMIPTYHPAGREGQKEKDAVYEQMIKEVAAARAE